MATLDSLLHLQLIADPAGPALDLEAPCAVTIGTVPLYNMQHVYANTQPPPPLPPPDMAPAAGAATIEYAPFLSAPPAADFSNEARKSYLNSDT